MKTIQRRDTVESVLVDMLRENTGTDMLDSGGAYGRAWQRNQKKKLKDFLKEPEVSYEHNYGYTISVFHYLRRDLGIDAVCKQFNKLNVPARDWDCKDFYGVSGKAGVYLLEELGAKIGNTFNSYNGESNLSQVIQGTWVDIGGKKYLVLQVHGGCDVRGGYTAARLFLVNGYEDGVILEDVRGTVTKKDGTRINIDNRYNGFSLTDENGHDVEITDTDKIELELMPN